MYTQLSFQFPQNGLFSFLKWQPRGSPWLLWRRQGRGPAGWQPLLLEPPLPLLWLLEAGVQGFYSSSLELVPADSTAMNMQLVFVHAQKGVWPCPSLIGTYNSCSYLPKALSKECGALFLHLPSSFSLCICFPIIFSPTAARLRRWRHHASTGRFLFFREVGEWVGGSFESEFFG